MTDIEMFKALKEMYAEEIKKIIKKGELTPNDSEAACKAMKGFHEANELIREVEDTELYSERRGRNSLGQYTSRSYTVDDMVTKLRSMRESAPDEESYHMIGRTIDTLNERRDMGNRGWM